MNVINCDACDNLQENAYEFVTKGVTDNVAASLKNDTGFNPGLAVTHTDCEDLNDANDCMVGRMIDEIESYESCDWKKYMHKLVPNLYNMLKAIIAAICGLWESVRWLYRQVRYLLCMVNLLSEGITIEFSGDDFIPGEGVNFNSSTVPVYCVIKGNVATFHGSVDFDRSNPHWGNLGHAQDGSPITGHITNTPNGSYTICLLRVKKSDHPELKAVYTGVGSFTNASCAQVVVRSWDEGQSFAGQWGLDESGRVTTPDGYLYVRIALTNLITWGSNGSGNGPAHVTFNTLNMVDIDADKVC